MGSRGLGRGVVGLEDSAPPYREWRDVMAEFFEKLGVSDRIRFQCYGERGIMSYFMFVALPTESGDFLADLQFPDGMANPFANLRGTHPEMTIYSELNFGNEGFGCPDGAILVREPKPAMVFLETKLHEKYAESCKNKSYNSTIKGQLELCWRMAHLHRTKSHREYEGDHYICETPEFKKVYQLDTAFYGHPDRQDETRFGSWRRLKISEANKAFLEVLLTCEDRVYFCAITKDEKNPLSYWNADSFPQCGNFDWSAVKGQFCWLPVAHIVKAGRNA